MPEVEAPLVGSEVDSSDPAGSALSIVKGIAGVGLMTLVVTYGKSVGDWATEQVDEATGRDGGASGDVVMGEF